MKEKKYLRKRIKEYWEDPNTVSLIDQNLRDLETETVMKYLKKGHCMADVGCGDAASTVRYAEKVKLCDAYETSRLLRNKAGKRISRAGLKNVSLENADVLEFNNTKRKYDVIVTQRVLINLTTWEEQKRAILNIYDNLKPGGLYIMVENTNEAMKALNEMRERSGMAPVKIHWHNLYFSHKKLTNFMEKRFKTVSFRDFGLYYFLTRVYVPMFADFKGFGKKAVKDPIFKYSDKAAKEIFDMFSGNVEINKGKAFGPIQVFVWQMKK